MMCQTTPHRLATIRVGLSLADNSRARKLGRSSAALNPLLIDDLAVLVNNAL